MEVEMYEFVHSICDVNSFIFGIKDLGGITVQQVLAKELILCLNEEHIFHGIKVCRVQTSRWMQWDGTF